MSYFPQVDGQDGGQAAQKISAASGTNSEAPLATDEDFRLPGDDGSFDFANNRQLNGDASLRNSREDDLDSNRDNLDLDGLISDGEDNEQYQDDIFGVNDEEKTQEEITTAVQNVVDHIANEAAEVLEDDLENVIRYVIFDENKIEEEPKILNDCSPVFGYFLDDPTSQWALEKEQEGQGQQDLSLDTITEQLVDQAHNLEDQAPISKDHEHFSDQETKYQQIMTKKTKKRLTPEDDPYLKGQGPLEPPGSYYEDQMDDKAMEVDQTIKNGSFYEGIDPENLMEEEIEEDRCYQQIEDQGYQDPGQNGPDEDLMDHEVLEAERQEQLLYDIDWKIPLVPGYHEWRNRKQPNINIVAGEEEVNTDPEVIFDSDIGWYQSFLPDNERGIVVDYLAIMTVVMEGERSWDTEEIDGVYGSFEEE